MKKLDTVRIVVVGAGGRGAAYAKLAKKLDGKAQIVGVAEPRDHYRENIVKEWNIPAENVFKSWEELAEKKEKIADAVIVATQDKMHTEPALAFIKKGYNVLLEKPMAPSFAECQKIVKAAKDKDIFFAVCHVMRYTKYTQTLKKILDEGTIGEIVSIQHLEEVGFWHQAHSYVRGNWRNEKESSFMLLAKSCHDMDWLSYLFGKKCKAVSSFGSLKHFKASEKPEGAGKRCTNCKCEKTCPYSAIKLYIDNQVAKGLTGWPVNVLTPDVTRESVMKALENGPYGRCVYACDNDVVDNQTVNLLFEDGKTAVFTMTGFSRGGRKTRIFGTRGEITGDESKIEIFDFLTRTVNVVDTNATDGSIVGGHGGGDGGIIGAFVDAILSNDKSKIITGPDATLESHKITFAAEKSRVKGVTVKL